MNKIILFALFTLSYITISAQSYMVKGTIADESGEVMIGVSIIQKDNPRNVTISDVDGKFSLTLPDDGKKHVVTFSLIGMQRKEIEVDKSFAGKEIKIVLEEDLHILDEVVVTGYGSVRKATIVGSVSEVRSTSKSSGGTPAGLLTAGEVNDFAKWALWDNIVKKSHSDYVSQWKMKPTERYTVQVVNKHNMPIADAKVALTDKKGKEVWVTRSDNTGKAELWANININQPAKGGYKIMCQYKGETKEVKKANAFSKEINTIKMDVACNDNTRADIMFVVDATGSMGDEIRYLQSELADVITRVKTTRPNLSMRIGSVFYRDNGDEYVTRISPLNANIDTTLDFINTQRAGGGGDLPEAVDEALEETLKNGGWHYEALARIAFLVLDAPCHDDKTSIERIHNQIRIAAEKGVRLIPIVCSGMGQDGEYLMRAMALATNGTTLFLTDDSGIGDTHLKPTTDKMEVEKLNDMIVRLIMQYTKTPDCNNDNWVEEDKKEAQTDKFVPDPYDAGDVEKKDVKEDDKEPIALTNNDVIVPYPNPCTDILQVKIKKNVDDLFLLDITGKSLQRFKKLTEGRNITINVSGYAAGIYFVKAFHNGKWYVQKVIVKGH